MELRTGLVKNVSSTKKMLLRKIVKYALSIDYVRNIFGLEKFEEYDSEYNE